MSCRFELWHWEGGLSSILLWQWLWHQQSLLTTPGLRSIHSTIYCFSQRSYKLNGFSIWQVNPFPIHIVHVTNRWSHGYQTCNDEQHAGRGNCRGWDHESLINQETTVHAIMHSCMHGGACGDQSIKNGWKLYAVLHMTTNCKFKWMSWYE